MDPTYEELLAAYREWVTNGLHSRSPSDALLALSSETVHNRKRIAELEEQLEAYELLAPTALQFKAARQAAKDINKDREQDNARLRNVVKALEYQRDHMKRIGTALPYWLEETIALAEEGE